MPQLEQIDSFIGQIFWLFVAFGMLYFFLAKYAVPRMASTVELRETTVSNNVNLAEELKNQSKFFAEEFEKKSNLTKAESFRMIAEANKQATSLYDSKMGEAEAALKKQIDAAEKDINAEKDKAFAELNTQVGGLVDEVVEKIADLTKNKATVAKVAKA